MLAEFVLVKSLAAAEELQAPPERHLASRLSLSTCLALDGSSVVLVLGGGVDDPPLSATRRVVGTQQAQPVRQRQTHCQLELRDGSFAPTASLAGLCDLLGQPQRLAIDRLAGAFTMQQGTIATKAMRWVSKGQEYGLTGNVHLDGRLDVTSLLQQHKDGRVIAAALGGRPLLAGLTGMLDAPTRAG